MPAEFSPPAAPRASKFSRPQVLRCAPAVPGAALLPDPHFIPAMKRNRQEKSYATACQILESNRTPPSHPRQGGLSLLPQRKARFKDGDQDPVLRRAGGQLRNRMEPTALSAVSARFTGPLFLPQHHGSRRPLQVLARPSETRISPRLCPLLIRTRSLRPYRSASRPGHASSSKGPSLISSSILSVARFPRARSDAHLGSLTSGVSISVTRILWPLSQIVTPSMTHACWDPVPHFLNAAVSLTWCRSPGPWLRSRWGTQEGP